MLMYLFTQISAKLPEHVYPFQLQTLNGIDDDDSEYFKVGDYHDVITIRSVQTATIKYEVCSLKVASSASSDVVHSR